MHAFGIDYQCVVPDLPYFGFYAADLAVLDENIREGRIVTVYDQSTAYEGVSRWLAKCIGHLPARRF
jgi:hypothetical protein